MRYYVLVLLLASTAAYADRTVIVNGKPVQPPVVDMKEVARVAPPATCERFGSEAIRQLEGLLRR